MSYVDDVLAQMKEKDAHEPEFLQVLTEILDSLRPIIEANEEKYRKEALLERLVEPEKVAYFRVPWTDDQGQAHHQPVAGEFSSTAQSARTRVVSASIPPLI